MTYCLDIPSYSYISLFKSFSERMYFHKMERLMELSKVYLKALLGYEPDLTRVMERKDADIIFYGSMAIGDVPMNIDLSTAKKAYGDVVASRMYVIYWDKLRSFNNGSGWADYFAEHFMSADDIALEIAKFLMDKILTDDIIRMV